MLSHESSTMVNAAWIEKYHNKHGMLYQTKKEFEVIPIA